jgi:hypothetical protein
MFPSWAVKPSVALCLVNEMVGGRAAGSLVLQASLSLLVLLTPLRLTAEVVDVGDPTTEDVVADSALAREGQPTTLKLGLQYGDPVLADRLRSRADKALALASHLGDFECRLSSEVLNCDRGGNIVLDGPFQDVLLNIPVSGQAHLEGSLRIVTVPDAARAALEMRIAGTVEMQGTGQTRGVRIGSDATSRFHAVKRLYLDHKGATSLPATCSAESSMVFTAIHSRQPKLLGKFAERIARQRTIEEKDEAEAECSDHVAAAIRMALDREADRLAQAIDRAIAEHLAGATDAQRGLWQCTRFRTETDCLSIARTAAEATASTAWQSTEGKPLPPILLRLPRAKFGIHQLLAGLHALGSSPAPNVASGTKEEPALAFRPSVSWQARTVTVSVDLEPAARLAKESVLGAAQ